MLVSDSKDGREEPRERRGTGGTEYTMRDGGGG